MAEPEAFDLVVIGAGFYGLAAAKTHLEVNPSATLAVLDAEDTIGGVWAARRLYPGLKTNNLLGTFEFGDFPMDTPTYGVAPGQHIPGAVVHRYLADYAVHFGVAPAIRFGTTVVSAEQLPAGGWLLAVRGPGGHATEQILARKLVVATGATTEPFMPAFAGAASFDAPLFHIKDFPAHAGTLDTASTVTVFGGAKSAWDAVYAYAQAGVKVEWIIRESDHGPTWMAPTHVTPLKRWLEKLVHTRFLTWLSPCTWGEPTGLGARARALLHGTALGRAVVRAFWNVLGADIRALNGYASHPELAKLAPWTDPFLIGASELSILNYDTDFFAHVRSGLVSVHIADVVALAPSTVHLARGERLKVDALVCATGWKQRAALAFLPASLDLGLPHPPVPDDPADALVARADAEIFARFPALREQPAARAQFNPLKPPEEALTPFRLHRFVVPPATLARRDIAFAGYLLTISTAMVAQAQGLWIAAYFSGRRGAVAITGEDEGEDRVAYEAVLHSRFGRWRSAQGFGGVLPDFVFDALPYVDALLRDMGVGWRRKGGWREVVEAYGPGDYGGVVGEWVERMGG